MHLIDVPLDNCALTFDVFVAKTNELDIRGEDPLYTHETCNTHMSEAKLFLIFFKAHENKNKNKKFQT